MSLTFENIKKTKSNLNYPSQLFINGKYQKSISEKSFENISPIDGSIINQVFFAEQEDIDLAVQMGFGVRYQVRGPLAQRDFAGLDLAATVQIDETDQERLKRGRQYLLELVARGDLGLKTGRGLLNWEGKDINDLQKMDDDRLAEAVAMLGIKAR